MTRILIVDDQRSWREFHTQAVRRLINDVEIQTSDSANSAYSSILENIKTPFDIILTDMQMENDYEPKYAGEWLIEEIKLLPAYFNTKIVIISASPNIKNIAENYGVDYIPKATAITTLEAYRQILN